MKTVPLKAAAAATLKQELHVNVLFLRMTKFIPLLIAQTRFPLLVVSVQTTETER